MAALTKVNSQQIIADYDSTADVLYITMGTPVPSEGEDAPRGVILRYSMKDDKPVGATVVGLAHNKWLADIEGLAQTISEHLHTPQTEISGAILHAIREGN